MTMHTLILSLNNTQLARYTLENRRYTVGRFPDNDIHIGDQAVSSHHAVLDNTHGSSVIEDLNSTNGTYVNNERVQKNVLKDGDIITLGRHQLCYLNSTQAPVKSIEAQGPELPEAQLRVLDGPAAGAELALNRALTTLGRADIQTAAIIRRTDGFFLMHVDSDKRGCYPQVNGADTGAEVTRLNDQDVIELAGVKIGFYTAS
jgi:predicted component of type VI protein secretion system